VLLAVPDATHLPPRRTICLVNWIRRLSVLQLLFSLYDLLLTVIGQSSGARLFSSRRRRPSPSNAAFSAEPGPHRATFAPSSGGRCVRRRARAADRQMPEPPGQRDRPDLPGEAAQRARTGSLVGAAIAHVAASATWSRSVAIRHPELTLLATCDQCFAFCQSIRTP
jgi:hypothetical protein